MGKTKEIDILLACDLYIKGLSITQISKSFNVSSTKIRHTLINNNVILRPKHIFNRKNKKNSKELNINYFKNIDSNDKAYWLGLITADGTIQKDGYKVSLTSKDIELIEKFKKIINSEHAISKIESFDKRTSKIYTRYLIQVCSKEFVKNIIFQGITNNKSHICEFPKIKEKFYLSFIRGLFDGDGCISFDGNRMRMQFIATKEILEFIQKYFYEKHKIEPHPMYNVSKNTNTFVIHYFKDTKKLLSLLYKNSNQDIRLNRKYKLYENKF